MNPIKKLKYKNFFHGHYSPVFAIWVISSLGSQFADLIAMKFFDKQLNYSYHIPFAIISFVLLNIVYAYFLRRLTNEDNEKIENSEFPEWLPVTDKIAAEAAYNDLAIDLVVYIIIFITFFILLITTSPPPSVAVGLFAVFIVIAAGVYFLLKHEKNFWNNIDDRAIYAKIPIDHTFRVSRRVGHDNYAVFYLPDGKYVVKVKSCAQKSVFILCYKNKIKVLDIVEADSDLINKNLFSY